MDSNQKTKLDELDPKTNLSLNLNLLKVGGLWWRDMNPRENCLKVFFYRCYERFVVLLYLSFNVSVFLHAILTEDDVAEFSESLLICVCQVLHGTRLIPVVLRRKKTANLILTLENNFYIHGKNLNHEEKSIIKNAISLAKKTTVIYFGSLCLTATLSILTPPTLALTSKNVNSTINQGHNLLIWKAWFPIDPTVYPYNIYAYIYQATITFIEGCFIIGGLNAFYIVLIIYTTSQFELLCSSLRNATQNIGDQMKEDSGVNKSSSEADIDKLEITEAAEATDIQHTLTERGKRNEALFSNKFDEHKVSTYIKECVQYHQHLLE
jgi:hypothetical protein